jgi:hypothetical protein
MFSFCRKLNVDFTYVVEHDVVVVESLLLFDCLEELSLLLLIDKVCC